MHACKIRGLHMHAQCAHRRPTLSLTGPLANRNPDRDRRLGCPSQRSGGHAPLRAWRQGRAHRWRRPHPHVPGRRLRDWQRGARAHGRQRRGHGHGRQCRWRQGVRAVGHLPRLLQRRLDRHALADAVGELEHTGDAHKVQPLVDVRTVSGKLPAARQAKPSWRTRVRDIASRAGARTSRACCHALGALGRAAQGSARPSRPPCTWPRRVRPPLRWRTSRG